MVKYLAKIEKQPAVGYCPEGYYLVTFPNCPGSTAYGKTLEEAKEYAAKALHVWLLLLDKMKAKHGHIPLPKSEIEGGNDRYTVEAYAEVMDQNGRATKSVSNQKLSMRSAIYDTYPFIPEDVLRQKYLGNRLPIRAIASEFACSKTYVRSLLLRDKIPLRKSSEYNGERWFAYGKRKVSGKTVDHKGELRIIAAIKKMYIEGMSFTAIARLLDTMKIPTKQQGKGWRYDMIVTILKREGIYVEKN